MNDNPNDGADEHDGADGHDAAGAAPDAGGPDAGAGVPPLPPGQLPAFGAVNPVPHDDVPWGFGRANAAPGIAPVGEVPESRMPGAGVAGGPGVGTAGAGAGIGTAGAGTPPPPGTPIGYSPTGAVPPPPVVHSMVPPVPYWRTSAAAPPMQYASFLQRLAARLLDGLVASGVAVVMVGLPVLLGLVIAGEGGLFFGMVSGALLYMLWSYYYLLHGLTTGHTVGRRTAGYYIAREDGAKLGLGKVIWREIVSMLSGMVLYIGFLAPLWSPKRQTWHDSLTGTVALVGEKPNVKGTFARPVVWTTLVALLVTAGLSLAFGDSMTEELEQNSFDWESEWESEFGSDFDSEFDSSYGVWRSGDVWWDETARERCEPLVYLELLEDRVEGATHHVVAEFSNGCDVGVFIDDPMLFVTFQIGECYASEFFDMKTEPVTVPPNQLVLVNLEFPATDCAGPIAGHQWMWQGVFSATLTEAGGPERVVASE